MLCLKKDLANARLAKSFFFIFFACRSGIFFLYLHADDIRVTGRSVLEFHKHVFHINRSTVIIRNESYGQQT